MSVCVITYNHEAYIAQCLESILAQRIDAPVEVLVGDDASPDRTGEIIAEIAARDSRIVPVRRPKNLGLVANQRDLCLRAQSDIIALCEGDDFWVDPEKLARQLAVMTSDPQISLAFTAGVKVSPDGDRNMGIIEVGGPSRQLSVAEMVLEMNGTVPTSSMVMRRSALMKIPEGAYELSPIDYALQVLLGTQGRVWYDASVTSAYRLSVGSWSEGLARSAEKYLQHYAMLRRYRQFLQEELGPSYTEPLRRAFEPQFLGFYMSSRITGAEKRRNLPLDLPLLSRRGRMIANVLARAPLLVTAGAFARRRIWGPFLKPLFTRHPHPGNFPVASTHLSTSG